MINLYVSRIIEDAKNGKESPFTIENVPTLWNVKTLEELNKRGYDGYGRTFESSHNVQ